MTLEEGVAEYRRRLARDVQLPKAQMHKSDHYIETLALLRGLYGDYGKDIVRQEINRQNGYGTQSTAGKSSAGAGSRGSRSVSAGRSHKS